MIKNMSIGIGIVLICCSLLIHNTGMSGLATGIATVGQLLGLPEMNISENISGSNAQTAPAASIGSGLLGNAGYIVSPVPGTSQNWPVSGGVAQGGPQSGQVVAKNPLPKKTYTTTIPVTGNTTNTGGGSPSPTSSVPQNPDTTYLTINGETKKLRDWMGQGVLDANGHPINGQNQNNDQQLIDDTYGQVMGYLNQNQDLLTGAKTAAEQQAASDLAANQGVLGTNRDQTMGQLATQGRGVQTQKEDALAAARRLFSELQRGNQQRFGGSTSAGQAASEIQGAEAQRQFGQTNRGAVEAQQKIEQAKTDVESQYKSGLLQLQQQQQSAMAKIQNDFTQSIMQINNIRAQTEEQKGAAKLQALQNLRSQAQAVQSQATQFQQQLYLMKEQSNLQINQYQQTIGRANTSGTNALSAYNQQSGQAIPYSQISGMQNGTTGQNLYVGSIKKSVTGRDQYGNYTYSDRTSGPGGFLNP